MMQIVRFNEWTVRGRWGGTLSFNGPAAAAIIHHSVTNPTGDPFADARQVEEIIYRRRIKSRFSMVAYSYLVHPDGTVFEGRGVRYRNGANNRTKPGTLSNKNTVSVCLIGTYTEADTTPHQDDAVAGLLEYLETAGQLANARSIAPHSALHATACCGDGGRRLISRLLSETSRKGTETMFVLKTSAAATSGWVFAGPRMLHTLSIGHWETVVGPSNVYVSEHAATFIEKSQPADAIHAPANITVELAPTIHTGD